MTRRYAIFDAAALGTSLSLDRGGTILTTDASGLNVNRTARGTIAVEAYDNFAEFYVYGDGAIANKVSVGIVTGDASLATYVGGDAEGIGYRVAEGQIHTGGGSIATVTAGALQSIVGVRLLFDPLGNGTVAFYLDGQLIGDEPLPSGMQGEPIYWAVSLGSDAEAGDIKVLANAGQDAFEHPLTGISDAGWWSQVTIPGAIRIADRPALTRGTDSPPYTRWEGGITSQDVVTESEFHCWVWGRGGSARGGAVSIQVIDERGLFDNALGGLYRDQPVSIIETESDLGSPSQSLGSFVLERIEVVSEIERRIVLRDSLAKLERGVQRRRILPDAAPDAAGRMWPTLLGACFSVDMPLIDELNYVYAVDSIGATGIGKVRDAGDPLQAGSPADYAITDGGQTITLTNVPFGIVTLDASTTGGSYVPPSPVDALGGVGDPFAGTLGLVPTGWTDGGTTPVLASGGQCSFEQNTTGSDGYITANAVTLTAGQVYRWEVTVNAMQQAVGSSGLARLLLCQDSNPFTAFVTINGADVSAPFSYPITYSGIYVPAVSHGVTVYYDANNVAAGQACLIEGMTFIELDPVDDTEPDDVVEDALEPLTLSAMLQELIETRGGLDSSAWQQSDAEALDSETGYRGLGLYVREQLSIRECIDAILDGYTAGVYSDEGVLRIARLVAPEDEASEASIGITDLLTPPLPAWDEMPGLSRQMGVRRNERILEDADLVTDEVAVTLALRRKLGRRHRFVTVYGGPLAPGYDHAEAAEPVGTRLVRQSDGQAEINRIGEIAATPRFFWSFTMWDRPEIKPGMIVTLTYPRFGLDAGVKLLVKRVRRKRLAKTAEVILWGTGPGES
jgi:hypothetical protein